MKNPLILLLAILAITACTTQPVKAAEVDYTSDEVINCDTAKYSRLIINSCLAKFKANTKYAGFSTFNLNGTEKDVIEPGSNEHTKTKIDYVPGLVAKALIECVDYYQDSVWAKPWYQSVEWYGIGTGFYDDIETNGESLDNLNAVKLYFKLKDLAPKFSANSATTITNCETAMSKALTGLSATNTTYSIKEGEVDGTNNANALPKPGGGTYDVTGGWFHKSDYTNQLWLDGQYMGPALLAQYVAAGQPLVGMTTEQSWDIIMKQFDITWTYLWNAETQLLYHAFCADGGTNSTTRSTDWAGLQPGTCYHSAEYWGRAEGWYVLALIDVIEQMDKAGMQSDPRRARLLGYLQSCAAGLKRWQDQTTGCWYQLLAHDGDFSVTDYKTKDNSETIKSGTKTNYLESSATAIFTATILKGMRLGYLDRATYEPMAKKAYHGFLKQFLRKDIDGNAYGLINCCASAGLGGSGKTGDDRRTGSAAYYLLGSDVTKVTSYTEGKVLGAFLMAAVEYERAYMYPPTTGDLSCNCLKVSLQ